MNELSCTTTDPVALALRQVVGSQQPTTEDVLRATARAVAEDSMAAYEKAAAEYKERLKQVRSEVLAHFKVSEDGPYADEKPAIVGTRFLDGTSGYALHIRLRLPKELAAKYEEAYYKDVEPMHSYEVLLNKLRQAMKERVCAVDALVSDPAIRARLVEFGKSIIK